MDAVIVSRASLDELPPGISQNDTSFYEDVRIQSNRMVSHSIVSDKSCEIKEYMMKLVKLIKDVVNLGVDTVELAVDLSGDVVKGATLVVNSKESIYKGVQDVTTATMEFTYGMLLESLELSEENMLEWNKKTEEEKKAFLKEYARIKGRELVAE